MGRGGRSECLIAADTRGALLSCQGGAKCQAEELMETGEDLAGWREMRESGRGGVCRSQRRMGA